MNDMVLAGIVVAGTVLALGGGSWLMSTIFKGKKDKTG